MLLELLAEIQELPLNGQIPLSRPENRLGRTIAGTSHVREFDRRVEGDRAQLDAPPVGDLAAVGPGRPGEGEVGETLVSMIVLFIIVLHPTSGELSQDLFTITEGAT
jgi:hypothetical protein